jgi:hypothetical protein
MQNTTPSSVLDNRSTKQQQVKALPSRKLSTYRVMRMTNLNLTVLGTRGSEYERGSCNASGF